MLLKNHITALFAASVFFITGFSPRTASAECPLDASFECPGSQDGDNCICVFPKEFWQAHTDCWPADTLTKTINGKLWVVTLTDTVTQETAWSTLAKEWIAAKLNVALNPGLENEACLMTNSGNILDLAETLLAKLDLFPRHTRSYAYYAKALLALNSAAGSCSKPCVDISAKKPLPNKSAADNKSPVQPARKPQINKAFKKQSKVQQLAKQPVKPTPTKQVKPTVKQVPKLVKPVLKKQIKPTPKPAVAPQEVKPEPAMAPKPRPRKAVRAPVRPAAQPQVKPEVKKESAKKEKKLHAVKKKEAQKQKRQQKKQDKKQDKKQAAKKAAKKKADKKKKH